MMAGMAGPNDFELGEPHSKVSNVLQGSRLIRTVSTRALRDSPIATLSYTPLTHEHFTSVSVDSIVFAGAQSWVALSAVIWKELGHVHRHSNKMLSLNGKQGPHVAGRQWLEHKTKRLL